MSFRGSIPPLLFAALLCASGVARAQCAAGEVAVPADRDNTLYEDPAGMLSNGAGDYLFAGRTLFAGLRRGLLRFDVGGNLPPGATVTAATLRLHMSKTPAGDPYSVSLHPALADWGEGTSDAGEPGGAGTAPATGDATWIHAFFASDPWAAPGGDFLAMASATATVSAVGPYTWGSTAAMVADVQGWLDDPASNFGWVLRGEELTPRAAQRFDSRQHPDPGVVPVLCVAASGGQLPVVEIPTLGDFGLLVLAFGLAVLALRRLA